MSHHITHLCRVHGEIRVLALASFIMLLSGCSAIAPMPALFGASPQSNSAERIELTFSTSGVVNTLETIELPATKGLVYLRPNLSIKEDLDAAITSTPYVELALIKNGPDNNWRLFHTETFTDVTTTTAQIHIFPSAEMTEIRSSPIYQISSMSLLAPAGGPGTPIPLDEAINLIKAANGESSADGGQLMGRRVAPFILFTDGAAENPTRALAIFGAIQADGSPNPPSGGACDDVRQSCRDSSDGYWYCTNLVVHFVCSSG